MVFANSASVVALPPMSTPGRSQNARPTSYTLRSAPSYGHCVVMTSVFPASTHASSVSVMPSYSGMPPNPKASTTSASHAGRNASTTSASMPGVSLSTATRGLSSS